MLQRIMLAFAICLAVEFSAHAAQSHWFEFKGLYVRMPAAEAKKLGLDRCAKGQVFEETCERGAGDKRFDSIGGAKIQLIGATIDKGRVEHIHIEAHGGYWDELIPAMKKHYGNPRKQKSGWMMWDRGGAEYITAYLMNGKISVDFAYDEHNTDRKIQERKDKALKDF